MEGGIRTTEEEATEVTGHVPDGGPTAHRQYGNPRQVVLLASVLYSPK